MIPQFKHSCPACKFLGISSDGIADLYSCNDGELIARYSDQPSDNASWNVELGGGNVHIREAKKIVLGK